MSMSNSQGTSRENLLQNVRSVIGRLLHDGKVVARSDNSVNDIFPVAINETQGEVLKNWVIKERAVHTIEIGLAWGMGALHICEGLLTNDNPNIHHIAIDPFQHHFKGCGLQSLEEARVLHLVEHLKGESQIMLPQFVSEGRQFDFAFVDGSHLFDRVFLDFIYLGRIVRPEGKRTNKSLCALITNERPA